MINVRTGGNAKIIYLRLLIIKYSPTKMRFFLITLAYEKHESHVSPNNPTTLNTLTQIKTAELNTLIKMILSESLGCTPIIAYIVT